MMAFIPDAHTLLIVEASVDRGQPEYKTSQIKPLSTKLTKDCISIGFIPFN